MSYPPSKVNCQYGAPMGRKTIYSADSEIAHKFNLRYVRLDNGGYDSGGAYWGIGTRLYTYFNDDVDQYLRAPDRKTAKAIIRETYPNAKFYN